MPLVCLSQLFRSAGSGVHDQKGLYGRGRSEDSFTVILWSLGCSAGYAGTFPFLLYADSVLELLHPGILSLASEPPG